MNCLFRPVNVAFPGLMLLAGFPAPGKIRENQGKKFLLESQGICQGKSGNFGLTEVYQVSILI